MLANSASVSGKLIKKRATLLATPPLRACPYAGNAGDKAIQKISKKQVTRFSDLFMAAALLYE
jgi:hypothetical protein